MSKNWYILVSKSGQWSDCIIQKWQNGT